MPEVFAPPPAVTAGFLAKEAQDALLKWNPLVAGVIEARKLFVADPLRTVRPTHAGGLAERARAFLRRTLFDRFGRR
jgi:hypothetical protein